MAINKDSILEMINNINLSTINDVNLFPELESFAHELMNSSNPQHRFTALKINNRLQENPHYQTYLKSDVIEKEIKEEAKEKQYFKAVYQNKEANAYQNIQTKKKEEKQDKENSLKETSSYQHNFLLYDKLFNQYGMNWDYLSNQEKQNFKIGIEKFSQHIDKESLYSCLPEKDKKNLNNGLINLQVVAVANQHNKASDEQFKKAAENHYKFLFDMVINLKLGEINQVQVLEQLSKEREKQTKLIDENPVFNDEQKRNNKKELAWQTDAVHHLYLITQSVQNQKKIDPDHITYMLGALYLENPSQVSIEIIKTLFNENQSVLDEIMKDPALKEKFIEQLIDSGNKRKNLQSILDDNPEIKDKLREYGIDVKKEIKKKEDAENEANKSSPPKEDVDKVTNNGNLSSTIEQHPNIGEKINPSESNVDDNENKVSLKLT
ncbi:Uncharacterised protein [Actinobacillus porcinus]|uniref:Uncharacterized protein n=1 Tax=Actinobacillus porcinus TaxID=51048 RepID=A0ABY6TIY8_9PAST|nr:hypothetical protein [Actinobacillus porcinus]VFY92871.1 Uncharacterised protein [Actinobacillus porcinus]VTU07339.1 Uncharacterised protein [Actinobacillus porcinus]